MLKLFRWRKFLSLLRLLSFDDERYQRRLRNLMLRATEQIDQRGGHWHSQIVRPKHPERNAPLLPTDSRAAVVLQGPLRLADDFTLETVRYYRSSMPTATVIVSTWNGEDPTAIKAMEEAGATVICSAQPDYPGPGNVNRQLRTTLAGIQHAHKIGTTYVMKSRTDTRINSYHVLDFLAGLCHAFPMKKKVKQRARIVVLDYATRMLIPNHPSDILMFGYTDDMLRYWSTPLSSAPDRSPTPASLDELWNERTPEVYLCESYLERIGYSFKRDIASWWKTLADLFVVVDRATIDHFWPKYGYSSEHRNEVDARYRALALCGFAEWVNLYSFRKTLAVSEDNLRLLPCDALLRAA